MIHFDIGKALHPRAFGYVTALIPGLFFEISILLNSTYQFGDLAHRAQVGYYTSLAIALFLAFVLGNAFMLFVRVVQGVVKKIQWILFRGGRLIGRALLNPIGRMSMSPRLPTTIQNWFAGRQRALFATDPHVVHLDASKADRALQHACSRLLKEVYGIEARPLDDAWGPYVLVLSQPSFGYTRGPLLVLASEATGWSGLAASQIASALRNRYYLGFSLFLVGYGLFVDWRLASNWNTESKNIYMRLDTVLRQLKKQPEHPPSTQPFDDEPDDFE